jgi:hypothetical protein
MLYIEHLFVFNRYNNLVFNICQDQIGDMLETSNWRFYGNHNQGHNHEIFLGETKPIYPLD